MVFLVTHKFHYNWMVSFYNKNKNNVSKCQSATPYLLNTIPQLLITESRKWRNTNLQIWLFKYVHLLVHQRQVILQFTVVGDHETFSFSIILRTSSSAQHLQIGKLDMYTQCVKVPRILNLLQSTWKKIILTFTCH